VRFAERMWDMSEMMVDQRTTKQWISPSRRGELFRLGLERFPKHAAVALIMSRGGHAEPLLDLVQRDAFARASTELCRKRGQLLCGRIGDHGLSFLLDDSGSGARVERRLAELSSPLRKLAQNFGFDVHFGVGPTSGQNSLPERYDAALAAAEQAVSENVVLRHYATPKLEKAPHLRELRRELAALVVENPKLLPARFARYFAALTTLSGYRFEPTRAHLEAAFEPVLDALRSTGVLDARTSNELEVTLSRSSSKASTVNDLSIAYEKTLSEISVALTAPKVARRERNLRRAIDHMREHLAEPLTRTAVARVAGVAPEQFSRLFSESEGVSFQDYLRRLRVERAKQMLESTELSVERVGQFSGFRTRSLFHSAFKERAGKTPAQYRKKAK
jgi:AraC-like DNA-binding protein